MGKNCKPVYQCGGCSEELESYAAAGQHCGGVDPEVSFICEHCDEEYKYRKDASKCCAEKDTDEPLTDAHEPPDADEDPADVSTVDTMDMGDLDALEDVELYILDDIDETGPASAEKLKEIVGPILPEFNYDKHTVTVDELLKNKPEEKPVKPTPAKEETPAGEIRIDTDIPIPPKRVAKHAEALAQLVKVGYSVLIPGKSGKDARMEALQAMKNLKRKKGWEFTTAAETGGCRVWRSK